MWLKCRLSALTQGILQKICINWLTIKAVFTHSPSRQTNIILNKRMFWTRILKKSMNRLKSRNHGCRPVFVSSFEIFCQTFTSLAASIAKLYTILLLSSAVTSSVNTFFYIFNKTIQPSIHYIHPLEITRMFSTIWENKSFLNCDVI